MFTPPFSQSTRIARLTGPTFTTCGRAPTIVNIFIFEVIVSLSSNRKQNFNLTQHRTVCAFASLSSNSAALASFARVSVLLLRNNSFDSRGIKSCRNVTPLSSYSQFIEHYTLHAALSLY